MAAQKNFNELNVDELKSELNSELQSQFKLRMQKSTGQLNQTHLLKQTRRNIARIKTVLRQKAGNE
jgi:large subunit ribosomal protein L29